MDPQRGGDPATPVTLGEGCEFRMPQHAVDGWDVRRARRQSIARRCQAAPFMPVYRVAAASRATRLCVRPLPQQGIAARTMIARFAHQEVERETGEVIGLRFHAPVLLLIEDLAIAPAAVAGSARMASEAPSMEW